MLALIGAGGIDETPELEEIREERVETLFDKPSAPITIGHLGGVEVAFLP